MSWMLLAAAVLVAATCALGGVWYGKRASGPADVVPPGIKWGAALCLAAAVVVASVGFWGRNNSHADSTGGAPSPQDSGPVIPVKTAAIRLSTIEETITVYGTVIAQLGETQVISVPYESRVSRLRVTAGEQVQANTPLLDIEPSAASRAQLKQAQDMAATAQKELEQVQEQYDQRLATNSQLLSAKQSFQTAQRTLDTLDKQGVGQNSTLTAQAAGIIRKVSVQQGQIVPPGAPLVENALANRIEVKLGIEPEDLPYVHNNARVDLLSVNTASAPTIGHVRLITRQVNPVTRLVDVFVSLPPTSLLMLEGYVRGTLVTASKRTLIVPREAILPEPKGAALFTVDNGVAVKHLVHVGLENATDVEIEGEHLNEGVPVVLTGNYELTSGMAVSPEKSP